MLTVRYHMVNVLVFLCSKNVAMLCSVWLLYSSNVGSYKAYLW